MTLQGNPNLIPHYLDNPPKSPFILMKKWFANALKINISEPFGFSIATVNNHGIPSSRVVLMKDYDDAGIIFCSSNKSRKGKELQSNSMASANFWWRETIQQIILTGKIVQLSDDLSENIFNKRSNSAKAIAKVSQREC